MFSTTKDPLSPIKLYYQQGRKQANLSYAFHVPQSKSFKKLHKVVVQPEKMKRVQEKLEADDQAFRNFKVRTQAEDFFLKYNYNPFLDLDLQNSKSSSSNKNLSRTHKIIRITDELNELSSMEKNNKQNARMSNFKKVKNVEKLKKQFQQFSAKLINNIEKRIVQQNTAISTRKGEDQSKNIRSGLINDNKRNEYFQMDIEEILKIPDHNFFTSIKINIFKLARDPNSCVSSLDHLRSKKFNFDSVVQRNYVFKTNIYRELSLFGRGKLCGWYKGQEKIFDYLTSSEQKFSLDHLSFWDILNYSTNRMSPDDINTILSEDYLKRTQDDDQESLDDDDLFIEKLFKKNAKFNFNMKYQAPQLQAYQIKKYRNLEFTQKELSQKQRLKRAIQQVSFLHTQKTNSLRQQVKDLNFHNKLSKKIQQASLRIMQGQSNKKINIGYIDKVSRKRKVFTDKSEKLELQMKKQLLQIYSQHMKRNKILSRTNKVD